MVAKKPRLKLYDFEYASKAITDQLKSLVHLDEATFSFVRIPIWGELVIKDWDAWLEKIISDEAYQGPFCLVPWKKEPQFRITAPTATECSAILIRRIWMHVFEERPVLFRTADPIETRVIRTAEYIRNHHQLLSDRLLDNIVTQLDQSEWMRLISAAEVERIRLVSMVDKNGTPKRKRGTWADERSGPPDGYQFGPIVAQLQEFAKSMELDARTIGDHAGLGKGSYWGKLNGDKFELWFRSKSMFENINEKLNSTASKAHPKRT